MRIESRHWGGAGDEPRNYNHTQWHHTCLSKMLRTPLLAQRRDLRVARQLRQRGWSVIWIWECRVANPGTLSRIRRKLDERG